MNKTLTAGRKLSGTVAVPPSKSIAHRALICAALARGGESVVTGVSHSEDLTATVEGLRNMGAEIGWSGDKAEVLGAKWRSFAPVDCGESGSTLRFLLPLALTIGMDATFFLRGRLGRRPLAAYEKICAENGILYQKTEGTLRVRGMLNKRVFRVRGDESSQFITGLALTACAGGGCEIQIEGALQSASYVEITRSVMGAFGVPVTFDGKRLIVEEGVFARPRTFAVEGDYSQSAFFLVANALGSDVQMENLPAGSVQGDRVIVDYLRRLKEGERTFDMTDCPDIAPIFALACALEAGAETRLCGAERLRLKESDRLVATSTALRLLGADMDQTADGFIIRGKRILDGGAVPSFRDHRIAMTAAIAATVCRRDVTIEDAECVAKSYPDFFEAYAMLGGELK